MCDGPTIDLGCGPGRLVAHLVQRGFPALGVDLSADRRRPGPAQRRARAAPRRVRTAARHGPVADGAAGRRQRRPGRRPVAGPAPGRRAAARRGGRCVAEFDATATGVEPDGCGWSRSARSARGSGGRSVGIDCAATLADEVGLAVADVHPIGDRVVASLAATVKTASLRGTAVTARVGLALGVAITVCFAHRPDQPFHPAPAAVVLLAHPPGLAVPSHAGPARHLRHRRDPAARSSSCGRCGPSCSSGPLIGGLVRQLDAAVDPGAGRRRCSSSSPPGC